MMLPLFVILVVVEHVVHALQARPLDVDKDMQPVVDFFTSKGLSTSDVVAVSSQAAPQQTGQQISSTCRMPLLWTCSLFL